VQDLFFNVPARRKFLKNQVQNLVILKKFRRLALTHFDIRFVLEHNDNIRLICRLQIVVNYVSACTAVIRSTVYSKCLLDRC
jgi:DNA mismatch repair ATPase MutL